MGDNSDWRTISTLLYIVSSNKWEITLINGIYRHYYTFYQEIGYYIASGCLFSCFLGQFKTSESLLPSSSSFTIFRWVQIHPFLIGFRFIIFKWVQIHHFSPGYTRVEICVIVWWMAVKRGKDLEYLTWIINSFHSF